MADGDLEGDVELLLRARPGNAVSGMYVAGEEIALLTSSSGLVGAVLAANQCPSDTGPVASNEVQGQIVKFDPKSESPVLQPHLHNPVAGIRGLSPNH